MKLSATTRRSDSVPRGTLAAWMFKDGSAPDGCQVPSCVSKAFRLGDLKGGKGETAFFYPENGSPERIVAVGLGARKDFGPLELLSAAGSLGTALSGKNVGTVSLPIPSGPDAEIFSRFAVEGLALGAYEYIGFRTDRHRGSLGRAELLCPPGLSPARALAAAGKGMLISDATIKARDLTNHPSNHLTIDRFADEARKSAKGAGLSFIELGPDKLASLGMGGILGVGKGSSQKQRLLVAEYNRSRKDLPTVVICGKGVMFDAGGVCVKPAREMKTMKDDMSGAGAALHALCATAELGAAVRAVAIMPCAENMPDGNALKPGDVVKTYNGKTVEVIDTDYEGRLLLADALGYSERFSPDAVVDIATLTYEVAAAVGRFASGLMTGHDRLAETIAEAGEACGEKVWRLPLWLEYAEQNKSAVADLKNVNESESDLLSSAVFLSEFAPRGIPWAHIDIGGTAYSGEDRGHIRKGATGAGVRLCAELLGRFAGAGIRGEKK